eukprot:5927633-Prymnesium_polylepis.1
MAATSALRVRGNAVRCTLAPRLAPHPVQHPNTPTRSSTDGPHPPSPNRRTPPCTLSPKRREPPPRAVTRPQGGRARRAPQS